MEQGSSAHHAADVGKILLQAQTDLKKIRESLAAAAGDGAGREPLFTAESLSQVVEKVETELRLKADAVLKTVVQGSPSTLPALGSYNFRGTGSTSAESLHSAASQGALPRAHPPSATLLSES